MIPIVNHSAPYCRIANEPNSHGCSLEESTWCWYALGMEARLSAWPTDSSTRSRLLIAATIVDLRHFDTWGNMTSLIHTDNGILWECLNSLVGGYVIKPELAPRSSGEVECACQCPFSELTTELSSNIILLIRANIRPNTRPTYD